MASKRPPSPGLIPNPFIKRRNREWAIQAPGLAITSSQNYAASSSSGPPSTVHPRPESRPSPPRPTSATKPAATTSAIEDGTLQITDHAAHFSRILAAATLRPFPPETPRLTVADYGGLYSRCTGSRSGAHFVIHQHDHPVAGTHYDLRLQINGTSSASWAVMYGLPGDPNSVRLNRNATETRVHCLWNHLIEGASPSSGSLLIWDAGTYAVLPRRSKHAPSIDPSSQASTSTSSPSGETGETEQAKLHRAFANRKIKLQLHGTRLPRAYVLNLRLTKKEDAAGRAKGGTPRRRRGRPAVAEMETTSESEVDDHDDNEGKNENKNEATAGPRSTPSTDAKAATTNQSAAERELGDQEEEEVARTNAHPGADNSIGSIHQRRWYLSLDRTASGLVERRVKNKIMWGGPPRVPARDEGENTGEGDEALQANRLAFPFYVRGPEHERSVVTGRLGKDLLRDEGVQEFVARRGWRPVLN